MVGENLTSRNRLAQMLMSQEQAAPPIQSHTQGLASLLRQGLAGYMQGADRRDRMAAQQAMMQGMQAKPWIDPDTGKAVGQAGGLAGAQAALQGLGGNEYAAEMGQNLQMQKFMQDEALKNFAQQMQIKKAFETPSAPKTIKTSEGVFILNPDGTLGNRLGGAKADTEIIMGGELKKGFRPTYDPKTGKQIGAEFIPGGSEDPEVIKSQKEAELTAKMEADVKANMPKLRSGIMSDEDKLTALKREVKEIKELSGRMLTSGGIGQATGWYAGSPQYTLNEKVKALRGLVGIEELKRAKAEGATFGSLTEKEMDLLISAFGAIDANLEPEVLNPVLDRALDAFEKNLERRKQTFEETYPNERKPWSGQGVGSHVTITNDAEYNALPSGSVFIDPNGVKRRKP